MAEKTSKCPGDAINSPGLRSFVLEGGPKKDKPDGREDFRGNYQKREAGNLRVVGSKRHGKKTYEEGRLRKDVVI